MTNSLAEANLRRGWTAQLRNERGGLRDYIILDDNLHAELRKLAEELTERRARKQAGISPSEPVKRRIVNRMLHPLDISE